MTSLTGNLDVLARAVHYKNLSAASSHVGLSQPQLSRIVQRLEEDLSLQLLDRSVRRKSAWTLAAHQLATLHIESQRRLEQSIRVLQESGRAQVLNMGTLEGLVDSALPLAKAVFEKTTVRLIHLNVYDQNELDEKFLAGDLDLILTARLPSKSKPKHFLSLGHQYLDWIRTDPDFLVQSNYEFGRQRKKAGSRTLPRGLVSNSLLTRRAWLERFGGTGQIPSALLKRGLKGTEEALLIGADGVDGEIWAAVTAAAR